ncbi:hypothetical protein, partial [Fulvivirga aurantia]|uniref:hypothetical protein n=1 Tax=Fulvivirga aurantia TaxID=2529383 RepID=UPI0016276E67
VYTYTYDSKVAILGDNATYYILGKGLSQFEGYINYASPSKAPHNHFPPGYPFFISIIMMISDNIQVIKIMNGLLTLGIGVFTYLVGKRMANDSIFGLLAALLVIMHAGLLYYSSIMMSEVL